MVPNVRDTDDDFLLEHQSSSNQRLDASAVASAHRQQRVSDHPCLRQNECIQIHASNLQAELFLAELSRLRNSVFHLKRSTDELKEADPNDRDVAEAIVENEQVIQKQQTRIEELELKLILLQPEITT
jgi:hypothetical protein